MEKSELQQIDELKKRLSKTISALVKIVKIDDACPSHEQANVDLSTCGAIARETLREIG